MRKKLLKIAIVSSLIFGNVIYIPYLDFVPFPFVSVAHAEVKTYVGVGKCRFDFGENDPDMIKKRKLSLKIVQFYQQKNKPVSISKAIQRLLMLLLLKIQFQQ